MKDPPAPHRSQARGGTLQGGRIHRLVENAREVTDHPVLAAVARVGLVAYGVLHLLIGWLTVQLARGSSRTDADQTGALQTVAGTPGGTVLLWLIGLGMLGLALWQGGEVLLWWRGLLDRRHVVRTAFVCAKCLAKAAVYGVLGATALLFALGLQYEADERFRALTGKTLEVPGGAALVRSQARGEPLDGPALDGTAAAPAGAAGARLPIGEQIGIEASMIAPWKTVPCSSSGVAMPRQASR
jgi:uncharacterized protein DUF1206